jgi:hypothetical protein
MELPRRARYFHENSALAVLYAHRAGRLIPKEGHDRTPALLCFGRAVKMRRQVYTAGLFDVPRFPSLPNGNLTSEYKRLPSLKRFADEQANLSFCFADIPK